MSRPGWRVLITCEHGGNRLPASLRARFADSAAALASHRGYDPGALVLARDLARAFAAPLIYATTSRLLVDLNRSPGHPRLFGEPVRGLPPAARAAILRRHYTPYRIRAERHVGAWVAAGDVVLHVSSHSFTPVLDGVVRQADVGLLYDSCRPHERTLCVAWQRAIVARQPGLRVRRNYPYRGAADGFTAYLRRCFAGEQYLGIELEVNQRRVGGSRRGWAQLRRTLVDALRDALVSVSTVSTGATESALSPLSADARATRAAR